MGTRIESLHVARAGWRGRHSALHLADAAARACLADADVAPGDVDLVVNTGIYRDRNLGEPAMAALIQDDLHINAEDPHVGGHGTFSFDLANGTCGPLSALQVMDAFLRAGTIRRGLVVTSDADPGHGLADGFPFAPVGAAAMCTWSDDVTGLGAFHWATGSADRPSLAAIVEPVGRGNRLRIEIAPDFAHDAAMVALEPVGKALASAGLQPADVVVVVAAPGSSTFLRELCRGAGVPTDRIVAAAPSVHTASLLVALETASSAGLLVADEPVLLVAAGAGITAGACTYRP